MNIGETVYCIDNSPSLYSPDADKFLFIDERYLIVGVSGNMLDIVRIKTGEKNTYFKNRFSKTLGGETKEASVVKEIKKTFIMTYQLFSAEQAEKFSFESIERKEETQKIIASITEATREGDFQTVVPKIYDDTILYLENKGYKVKQIHNGTLISWGKV